MEPEFWRERWSSGRIGFHLATPNPRLLEHVGALTGSTTRRVLVPLCGKSLDLAFLGSHGFEVVGVELVEDAARAFFEEQELRPSVTTIGNLVHYAAGSVAIVAGDFFETSCERLGGPFDAAFDRAALIALPPELRERYVGKVRELLGPGAPILLVLLDFDAPGGPPFSVSESDASALYSGASITRLGSVDVFDDSPMLRERGATRACEITLRIET